MNPIVTRIASLFLLSTAVAACDDSDVPTEAGENDENDPNADEDDPAAAMEPPANWTTVSTSVAPTQLRIYANGSESNAGTGASLKLSYINKIGTYSCTVAGVPSGASRTCTPSKTGDSTHSDYDRFYLAFATSSNTDGLRFSTISATISGTEYGQNSFFLWNDPPLLAGESSNMDCTGCGLTDCASCYLDGNNHTDCINVMIPMQTTKQIVCKDTK